MIEIEKLIVESYAWLEEHRKWRNRDVEKLATNIRIQALCDAYRAVGGDDRRWRENGIVL